ncbi:hypothetical protein P152DRAFT_432990 [Eremomyces bilateralis CBS 781.70]|uniref:Calponin-homology (CH) domain-containing protein n=1 Tax=Eremomyces bilateralis CBS 781.70 TaxID=1392243 RepID=A0A6G1G6H5_9PEZI|nr:uncharacterized protein P152DRAFT_432990 [Eremomyces bilateralis CBS 781.70]KAF1813622.1 hypothetical protein P152DRAFT_432990 [Eremomyces bilateralis CBS 781.70]
MASVSSLDQDMRKLRLGRYTPQAANEIRLWIEDTLGEKLPPGDLLDVLKDGTVLCRLANLALPPPGIKFKKSNMPFMQMENISHFLKACEMPPLNLQAHDRFLTVDLYEAKDPAQVLQCMGAFSRVAHSVNPTRFRTTIGPKRTVISPTTTGSATGFTPISPVKESSSRPGPSREMSPTITGGSNSSKTTNGGARSPPSVSSWSKRKDEHVTSPAWNIAQYGYMGGASQGNQGIAFGARRQITSAAPNVPSLAEKERKRKEKEAEDQRLRQLAEEAENIRRIEREAEEERIRVAEERRWEDETRRLREEEKKRVEQQKVEWEEQERRWKAAEEARLREEREAQEQFEKETQRPRAPSDAKLRGQYLSDYKREQVSRSNSRNDSRENTLSPDRQRVVELERQLAEAKERERQYELEREEKLRQKQESPQRQNRSRSRSRPRPPPRAPSPKDSEPPTPARPLPNPSSAPTSSRPLPDPTSYRPKPPLPISRTDQFLSSHPAPTRSLPTTHQPSETAHLTAAEQDAETARRHAAQQKTKAGGWASKSLLEREMERERERQQEWEEAQKASRTAKRDLSEGTGEGQSWDVNQYGYMGGDGQNRGGSGIGFGARRQIIGPRPKP